ncbi:hypothetical protein ACS0TY_020375 [Phlomoides rotata]
MKLMSYNVRGLGGMAKKKEIRKLIRELRVDGCCIQETKMENVEEMMVRKLWGKGKVDWAFKVAKGNAGGILTIWNTEKFQKSGVWDTMGMLVINGVWIANGMLCVLINVYAPNNMKQRWELWDNIATVAEQYNDTCVGIIRDFNAIREPGEICGRSQNTVVKAMDKFEDFINLSNLTELKMIRKKYTVDKNWLTQVLKGGRRTLSNHRPIYIEERKKDWGPKPFKLFNWWLKKKSVVEGWCAYRLKEKLKALKFDIKQWSKCHIGNLEAKIANTTEEIEKLDAIDDTLGLDEEEISERNQLMEKLSIVMNRREAELI